MSDVNYLSNNAAEDSYIAFIDSSMRDLSRYPSSSNFVSDFTVPFSDVFSVDVLDVKIPLSSYTIDGIYNHEFAYRFEDSSDWHLLRMPPGHYKSGDQLADVFNAVMDAQTDPSLPRVFMRTFTAYYRTHVFADQKDNYTQVSVASGGSLATFVAPADTSTPIFGTYASTSTAAVASGIATQHEQLLVSDPRSGNLASQYSQSLVNYTQQAEAGAQPLWAAGKLNFDFTGRVFFFADQPFSIHRELTTSKRVMGLAGASSIVIRSQRLEDLIKSNDPNVKRLTSLLTLIGLTKIDPAMLQKHFIFPESAVDLQGPRYIQMRCPEIESQWYRNRAYENHNMGLAIVAPTQGSLPFSLISTPSRRFHPISKLDRLTFRFETPEGRLVDFNGAEVLVTLAIRFYRPREVQTANSGALNPYYNADSFRYMTDHVLRDGDSSDEDPEFEPYPAPQYGYSFDRIKTGLHSRT